MEGFIGFLQVAEGDLRMAGCERLVNEAKRATASPDCLQNTQMKFTRRVFANNDVLRRRHDLRDALATLMPATVHARSQPS